MTKPSALLVLAGWALLAASCGGAGNPSTSSPTPAPITASATSTLDPSPTPLAGTQTPAARVERIVYIGVDGNVWSMDPAGKEKLQLSSDGGNSAPRWSPDGTRVAFVHWNGEATASRRVELMAADGRSRVVVADSLPGFGVGANAPSAYVGNIRWSADSCTIYAHVAPGPVGMHPIQSVPLCGGSPKEASFAHFFDVRSDGTFVRTSAGGGEPNRLEIGKLDGSGDQIAKDSPEGPVAWSRDGTRVALRIGNAMQILDTSGEPVANLVASAKSSGFLDQTVAWSPDGREIAYDTNDGVSALDLSTGTSRVIGEGSQPDWGQTASVADRTVIVAGTGDCLNAREEPNVSATKLACLVDGTRGRVTAGPKFADGYIWVMLESVGWVVVDFLQPCSPGADGEIECPVSTPASSLDEQFTSGFFGAINEMRGHLPPFNRSPILTRVAEDYLLVLSQRADLETAIPSDGRLVLADKAATAGYPGGVRGFAGACSCDPDTLPRNYAQSGYGESDEQISIFGNREYSDLGVACVKIPRERTNNVGQEIRYAVIACVGVAGISSQ